MRGLWESHGTWTERAIVDFVGGLPDTPLAIGRLLQNQTDIGDAVKPYYGRQAGDELTALLKGHINAAVPTDGLPPADRSPVPAARDVRRPAAPPGGYRMKGMSILVPARYAG